MDALVRGGPGESFATRPTEPSRATERRDAALLMLGLELKNSGYRFTAVTPATHRRVNVREPTLPRTAEDVFGWSRSFSAGEVPQRLVRFLVDAGELVKSGPRLRSSVRFCTLDQQIFVHSAYPTEAPDAVFFGPDTYRFARLVRQFLPRTARDGLKLLDLGAGSGAGGLHAASLAAVDFSCIVLSDINRRALRFCRINALLNGIDYVEVIQSDLFQQIDHSFDLIIANPPYLVDPRRRLYRHGGGPLGGRLSTEIAKQSIEHLAPAGRLVLYTGSAVVNGVDSLRRSLSAVLNRGDIRFHYEEIDPDVFSEELEHSPYDQADRIAVIGLVIDRVG